MTFHLNASIPPLLVRRQRFTLDRLSASDFEHAFGWPLERKTSGTDGRTPVQMEPIPELPFVWLEADETGVVAEEDPIALPPEHYLRSAMKVNAMDAKQVVAFLREYGLLWPVATPPPELGGYNPLGVLAFVGASNGQISQHFLPAVLHKLGVRDPQEGKVIGGSIDGRPVPQAGQVGPLAYQQVALAVVQQLVEYWHTQASTPWGTPYHRKSPGFREVMNALALEYSIDGDEMLARFEQSGAMGNANAEVNNEGLAVALDELLASAVGPTFEFRSTAERAPTTVYGAVALAAQFAEHLAAGEEIQECTCGTLFVRQDAASEARGRSPRYCSNQCSAKERKRRQRAREARDQ